MRNRDQDIELFDGEPKALGEPEKKPFWKQSWFWVAAVGVLVMLFKSATAAAAGSGLDMRYTDKKSFVKMMDAVLSALGLAPETRLIVMAHAGVETALGTAGTGPSGNNFWNITAGSYWTGNVVLGGDQEPDGQGGWKNITQKWRAYATPLDGAKDYLNFLSRSTPVAAQYPASYADAWAYAVAGDVSGFVYTLRDAGYFTADPAKYLSMMNGQIGLVQSLLQG